MQPSPQRFSLLSSYGQHPSREEYRTLWCLFLADKEPFKVDLPLNLDFDVDDLKGLIHIKAIDTTKSTVLARDLILWRVSVLFEQF